MLFASITNVAIVPMLSEFLQEELITDQLFVGQTTAKLFDQLVLI